MHMTKNGCESHDRFFARDWKEEWNLVTPQVKEQVANLRFKLAAFLLEFKMEFKENFLSRS